MASYPTSVKTFASRNAGDTIQPSHVNDLQDEVNALEAGLLNGTANLNSSNTTVTNLNVTGKSTFVGQVTFGSTFTFSTAVTADAQPRCRVFYSSTQVLANNSEAALTFDSEDFDIGGLHSTASNPTRITIQSTGVWMFGATCHFASAVANMRLRFRKNGATVVGSAGGIFPGGGAEVYAERTVIDQMTSTGDYMEVLAFQNGGSTLQTGNASSRVDQNEFWAVKLW